MFIAIDLPLPQCHQKTVMPNFVYGHLLAAERSLFIELPIL